MEKALEILTNLLQAKSYDENYPSDYEIQEAIREINNYVDESESIRMLSDDMGGRIAELEEAQETIKDLKHNYDVQVEYNNTAYKNYTNMVNSLEQRIEAMKPKTCLDCKHYSQSTFYGDLKVVKYCHKNRLGIGDINFQIFCCNKFEPKDTQC